MCYICSPTQFKFYGRERLTVCEPFCNEMYEACGESVLKGSKINEIYSNGYEFCVSRRYNVEKNQWNDNCFNYRIIPESNSAATTTSNNISFFIILINVLKTIQSVLL
jgi:hypothetical protein